MQFEQNGCFASWDGARLHCGNALFSARFHLDRGVQLTDLNIGGRAWATPPDAETDSQEGVQWSADFGAALPVGAPALRITAGGAGPGAEWKIWPDIAGFQLRLPENGAPVTNASAGDAHAPTGVELAEETLEPHSEGSALRLSLKMTHGRLQEVEFRDQSDFHNELVFERERLLLGVERVEPLQGNVWAVENTVTGEGMVLVKHAALPAMRPAGDTAGQADFEVRLSGDSVHCTLTPDGYTVAALFYQSSERTGALQKYGRALRVPHAERDGMLLSNTWGDRSRDGAVCEEFMLREAEAAARLGVDVLQIDDGWQRGTTANSIQAGGVWEGYWATDPEFWTPHPTRFPRGLAPVKARCSELGLKLGLWFSPDSADDCANWERDAEVILHLHREEGANFFKLDGLDLESRAGAENFHRFCTRVLEQSEGRITFDLDITAETRPGYWGEPGIGALFVENRYTDWHRYWPHATLRNLWQLARWMPPHQLRMEFLNNARHTGKYEGDPLAPSQYKPDYLFATVMLAAPLGWFEVQNLAREYIDAVAPLVALWKQHRDAITRDAVVPIGTAPDGTAWTGFVSGAGYALIFREFNNSSATRFELGAHDTWTRCELLAGEGSGRMEDGTLLVEIPEKLRFAWFKLS